MVIVGIYTPPERGKGNPNMMLGGAGKGPGLSPTLEIVDAPRAGDTATRDASKGNS